MERIDPVVCGITDFFYLFAFIFEVVLSPIRLALGCAVSFFVCPPSDDQTPLPLRVCPVCLFFSCLVKFQFLHHSTLPRRPFPYISSRSASAYKIARFQPSTIQYSHILRYIPPPGPTPFNFAHRRERWDGKKSYTTPPKRPLPQTPLLGFWIFRIRFM